MCWHGLWKAESTAGSCVQFVFGERGGLAGEHRKLSPPAPCPTAGVLRLCPFLPRHCCAHDHGQHNPTLQHGARKWVGAMLPSKKWKG